ncbi:Auxin response factor 3 [Hordeum vulgare]|nr:Auxin response factor 3 [Hordeum vulgare]
MHPNAHNLFNRMSVTDDETANYFIMENIIFEGHATIIFDPHETQIEDGRGPFMTSHTGTTNTFDQGHGGMADPFTQGQYGMGNTFPQDHEIQVDNDLEEEDEVDIDGEPLIFGDKLSTQANANKKCQSIQTKAYKKDENKLLCGCWRAIGQDSKAGADQNASTFWLRIHRKYHERKKFMTYKMESER